MNKSSTETQQLALFEAIEKNLVKINHLKQQLDTLKTIKEYHLFCFDKNKEKRTLELLIKDKEQQIMFLFTELPTE